MSRRLSYKTCVYSLRCIFKLKTLIKVFNINSCQLTYYATYVFDLVIINSNILASSSADKTIRLWNLPVFTCKFNLTDHTDRVRGLKQISFDILASGSWDATIKFLVQNCSKLTYFFSGHIGAKYGVKSGPIGKLAVSLKKVRNRQF